MDIKEGSHFALTSRERFSAFVETFSWQEFSSSGHDDDFSLENNEKSSFQTCRISNWAFTRDASKSNVALTGSSRVYDSGNGCKTRKPLKLIPPVTRSAISEIRRNRAQWRMKLAVKVKSRTYPEKVSPPIRSIIENRFHVHLPISWLTTFVFMDEGTV